MNHKSVVAWVATCCFVFAAASASAATVQGAPAHKPHVRVVAYFDVPGQWWGISYPILINDDGVVAGSYYDVNSVRHGFIRNVDGAIVTLDPVGSQSTWVSGINDGGSIVGSFDDGLCSNHGFLRSGSGRITTLDAPNNGSGCLYSVINAINNPGVMVGGNADSTGVAHGFVLTRSGTFVDISGPGNLGTYCFHLNDVGEAGCEYFDVNGVWHGLLHYPGGVNVSYDAPGAGTASGQGTFTNSSQAINGRGQITGQLIDRNYVFHGYLRHPNGTFTVFDAPGAGTVAATGTWPSSVNDSGTIVGSTYDQRGIAHGFVRFANGQFAAFDATGAGTASAYQGTFPFAINSDGLVAGYYFDADWHGHGFIVQAVP